MRSQISRKTSLHFTCFTCLFSFSFSLVLIQLSFFITRMNTSYTRLVPASGCFAFSTISTCNTGSSSSHALERRGLVSDLLLPCQLLLVDEPGVASCSSSSSVASQMDAVEAGLRRLVMEFNTKYRILRGLESSLKAALCGVQRAFSANSSEFLIKVIGTSTWTHIMKRGPAAFSPCITKSLTSACPSVVHRSETTSS